MPTDTRECKQCHQHKPLSAFKQKRLCCIECDKNKAREKRLKKWFNISLEEYDRILKHQGGVCAICKKPPKEGKSLAVDHDHATGQVRGLLCSMCNRAIAVFRDSLEKLMAAAKYFTSFPATEALGGDRFGLRGRVTNKAATVRRLNKDRLPQ